LEQLYIQIKYERWDFFSKSAGGVMSRLRNMLGTTGG